jgi:hypothetical protein
VYATTPHSNNIAQGLKKKQPLYNPPTYPKLGIIVGLGLIGGLAMFRMTLTKHLNELATWDHERSVLANRVKFQLR